MDRRNKFVEGDTGPGGGALNFFSGRGVQPGPGGGDTQYKSGYRDVPQTWVAKSGRQVHQWVPFFSKNMVLWWVYFSKFSKICAKMAQIWYFDWSTF